MRAQRTEKRGEQEELGREGRQEHGWSNKEGNLGRDGGGEGDGLRGKNQLRQIKEARKLDGEEMSSSSLLHTHGRTR